MRLHLFEFEDQPWFPQVLRVGLMDYLRHMITWFEFYKPAAVLIKRTLEQSGESQIIELCAGGGGGVLKMRKYLDDLHCSAKIFLTDLYPNVATYEKLKEQTHGEVDFIPESVNALNVPEEVKGMRVMFTAFHHFKPVPAKKILQDAAEKQVSIAIFDTGQNWFGIFLVLLLEPVSFFLLTPFFKPFRWSRLLFTYIIPLIPICTLWDGCVSILRLYSLNGMKRLTSEVSFPGYKWKVGQEKNSIGIRINYILGVPL